MPLAWSAFCAQAEKDAPSSMTGVESRKLPIMVNARHDRMTAEAVHAHGQLGPFLKAAFVRSTLVVLVVVGAFWVVITPVAPASAQTGNEAEGWIRIESVDSRLVFHAARYYGDRLPNAARRHVPAEGPSTAEGAFWAPANKGEPMAGLYFGALAPPASTRHGAIRSPLPTCSTSAARVRWCPLISLPGAKPRRHSARWRLSCSSSTGAAVWAFSIT